MSSRRLEDLFIEKLSEKFPITERGIKQAFSKFDRSKDGLLDMREVNSLMRNLLNGIPARDIESLARRFDQDGDGKVSYEEFFYLITHRDAIAEPASPEESSEEDSIPTPLRGDHRSVWGSEPSEPQSARSTFSDADVQSELGSERSLAVSQASSRISVTDRHAIESRAALFLRNLKTSLLRRASQMRDEGKVSVHQRLGMHSSELIETIAKGLLTRAFKPYVFLDGKPRVSDYCVSRSDFTRVLRSFVFPGTPTPQTVVIDYIFVLCCSPSNLPASEKLASPTALITAVFPPPRPLVAVAPSDAGVLIRDGQVIGKPALSNDSIMPLRKEVGRGPMQSKDASLPLAVTNLPLKFISRKSRTSLLASSTIDSATLNRSNQLPTYSCVRDHVFGFSSSRLGFGSLYSVNSGVNNSLKDDCLVYSCAALGVVHDLKTNTQVFFDGHTDDISCIALCTPPYIGGYLVATGQMGKAPVLLLWSFKATASGSIETSPSLATIGKGFFQRMVVSAVFSFDGAYITAISGDDHHMMGVWDIQNGELIHNCSTQNGIPPQIRGIYWAPGKVTTEWISGTENIGPCDLICTAGERHLKFWSLARPKSTGHASVKCCGAKIGKMDVAAPKSYLCADFIVNDNKNIFDIVSGGSNGIAYLWRNGSLIAHTAVCKGPLSSVRTKGSRVICGGAGGIVKVLDARTLSSLQAYSLSNITNMDIRPSSASSGEQLRSREQRPVSSGRRGLGGVRPRSSSVGNRPSSAAGPSGQSRILPSIRGLETNITSLAICEDRRSRRGIVLTVVALTSAGVAVSVDLESPGEEALSPLFFYHNGAVNSVARVPLGTDGDEKIVTCGEDKLVCIWNTRAMLLEGRYKAQSSVVSCDVNSDGSLIGIGLSSGAICLLYRDSYEIGRVTECAFRKDANEEVSDVKFSPSGATFAAGSHDNIIYIYSCIESTPTDGKGDRGEIIRNKKQYSFRPLQKLKGHSSYITHIDWSRDGCLLRSTCGAYELLIWDVGSGKISSGVVEADVKWNTHTCVLGFNVMGIWPKYSDGTDINAVDVSKKKNIIATADDFGKLNILNFPCVVNEAPRKSFSGHSSFVTCVRFNGQNDDQIVTSGGQDCCIIIWKVI